jgi:hypothetical protein
MKKTLIILALVTLCGCSKEEGYTIKKYNYKVNGYGFNCDAYLKVDGKKIDLNKTRDYKFESRYSFEVTFTPKSSNYVYQLYVERENTWHQEEKHDSYLNGVHGEKTYIVK